MNPNGHVALVTGGASGLGEATARRLAQAGARVAIVERNFSLAEAVARDIGGSPYKLDVTDSAAAEAFFVQLAQDMGVARILVNCAGLALAKRIVGRDGPHGLDEFAKIMNVNVMGSFNMLRLAAAAMMQIEPLADGERGVAWQLERFAAMRALWPAATPVSLANSAAILCNASINNPAATVSISVSLYGITCPAIVLNG
jgi:NAD(P)-dependent dehydrogenase (short-subunit alcohol dehydrogenase family)